MRLLDLFCGAGGAAMGYARAGFEVVGVDIHPQPRYPFAFVQADALAPPFDLSAFDAIHASPPCQDYSRALRHLASPQPRLIDPVQAMLVRSGLPYVIENVEGSSLLRQPSLGGGFGVVLCGTSFGLPVYRHRLFESSVPIPVLPCDHSLPAMNPHNQRGRDRIYAELGRGDPERPWREAMGVGWMTKHEGREAIPPAYTEHIGQQLLERMLVNAEEQA